MQTPSYNQIPGSLQLSEGNSIAYTDFQPAKDGGLVPIVYLPGLMRTARDFDRVAPKFAAERRVITIDTRGRGKGARSDDPAFYDFDAMIGDVWTLLDHLKIERFVLVGLALGAFMSMRMGGQRPDRVMAIVTNDSGTETVSKVGKKMVALADQGLYGFEDAVEKLRVPNAKNFRDFGPDDWRDYTRLVYAEVEPGKWKRDFHPALLENWAAFKETNPSMWPDCLKLGDVPLIVLRGAESEYLPAEQLDRITSELKAGRVVSVQGRGHPLRLDEPMSLITLREVLADADARA